MSTATIAQKVALIFGIGTQLVGSYTTKKVVYSDGKSKLEFDVTDENRKQAGNYVVTVKSEDEIDEQFQQAPAAVAATGTKDSTPTARQSPSNYLSGRDAR